MTEAGSTLGWNLRWARTMVSACCESGCNSFFLAPGSRCSPLTLAVAECREARVIQHFDERGLAFACLGFGRATGRPGIFICTSGTAVANAWPAVVEASMDHIPMLLLTADRPPELRGTGANQTIDQEQLFGRYTSFFFDLPCPAPAPSEHIVRNVIHQAIWASVRGPAHLNCMFREPLVDDDNQTHREQKPSRPGSSVPWTDPGRTSVESADSPEKPEGGSIFPPVRKSMDPFAITTPATVSLDGGNTLVLAAGCRPEEARAAQNLAARLECPFLADVTSGLRGPAMDLALIAPDAPPADTVIHVGGRVVSKRWWQWLDRYPPKTFLQLRRCGPPIDPIRRVTQFLEGSLDRLSEAVVIQRRSSDAFHRDWRERSHRARLIANQVLDANENLNEPGLARHVARLLPSEHGLFLGNSMPIRDMDTFGDWPEDRSVPVGANRGASGIDGLLGSALGMAIGLDRPVTAIVGDLSLLHDVNSLAQIANHRPPVIVIVVNNDGGGIFHFLPIVHRTDHFEQYFATPHGLNLQHAAQLFRLDYHCPSTWFDFERSYRESCERQQPALIEVRTDRRENLLLHRQIEQAIRDPRK